MDKLPFEDIKREVISLSKDFKLDNYIPDIPELLNNGIILIDKPAGPTSHQVSDQVKKILNINKAGHSGTLDPNVTGVLPIALGNGTKVIQALLNAGKEYVCVMHVHDDIAEEKLREVINSFVGRIKQVPPVKSAVKRQERIRTVYYINILEIKDRDVLFKVGCQAGTYIRKLCSDIGEKLGSGAHMAELRRTKAGPFNESELITLHDLTDAFHEYNKDNFKLIEKILLPIEAGIKHLPKIWVKNSTVESLCHGAQLNIPGIALLESNIKPKDMVAILDSRNKLILLGNAILSSKEIIDKKEGMAVKTLRVFMVN